MDAATCVPLEIGPADGGAVCPKAGVAAAAKLNNKRRARRRALMISSLS